MNTSHPRYQFLQRRFRSQKRPLSFGLLVALISGVALFLVSVYSILHLTSTQDQGDYQSNDRTAERIGFIRKQGDIKGGHEMNEIENILDDGGYDTLEDLQQKLRYWRVAPGADSGLFRSPSGMVNERYVLFETDCGGFNNVRMAFEHFILMAWVTRRVLVLPPPKPWYLIDFGPLTRMRPDQKMRTVSTYEEFFNIEHLKAAVPVITTEEFRRIEGERLGMPDEVLHADLGSDSGRRRYKDWMFTESDGSDTLDGHKIKRHLQWGPLRHVLFYPSIEAVEKSMKAKGLKKVPSDFVHHREPVELTAEIQSSELLIFPSCLNNENARYLGQVAAFAAFSDEALSRSYKRMLKDHVHFHQVVFDKAALILDRLRTLSQGAASRFNFVALHVRRNDLQYKEVFMSAGDLYGNIKPLIKENEVFYIASDEKDDGFFDIIKNNGHQFYRWKDFADITGSREWKETPTIRKLEGCIEQVVCANGRIFFGTLESTFTSYIFRLRGYLNAPVKEVYYHTLKYKGEVSADRRITYARKPPKGQIYKSEHPSIWEDAVSLKTFW